MSDTAPATATVDEIAGRVFAASIAGFEAMSIYVGDRLGWYTALVDTPSTAAELAARTGTAERYAREWLEFQAVSGFVTVDDVGAAPRVRRYTLPAAAAEVLTDGDSLAYLGPLPRMMMGSAIRMPELLDAYRSGGGVSWDQFGADARESQADLNRPWFRRALPDAFAGVPAVADVLGRPGSRIADIGCGGGWSTIALAAAYPDAVFTGYDLDVPSIAMARSNAENAGAAVNLRFSSDTGAIGADGPFDLVLAFECVHDMAHPVEVLATVRAALAPGGSMIVMDEGVADEFTAPGDDIERFMYGCSVFICLPDGMSTPGSAGTGTVMRAGILADYATRAGFSSIEVLPIDNFNVWRFYRLTL